MENRPLAYWYESETTSEITAFGWKFSDEDIVHTLLLLPDGYFEDEQGRRWPDHLAYGIFVGQLESADVAYGHNIRRHDLPMLQAGLLRRQMSPLKTLVTTDTCRDIPKRSGMSASLENLADFYGLEGEKFGMSQHKWEQANRLTVDGIALARRRVVSDVLLQERLYHKLKELGYLGSTRVWKPSR